MDAPASASNPPPLPPLNLILGLVLVNQPNTQPLFPPSIVIPPYTQTKTQKVTLNGGKQPFKIWVHFTKIESCDPIDPKSHCNY